MATTLLYGATGYTGALTAETATRLGNDLILAGRSPDAVRRLAATHGFEWRSAGLGDPAALDRLLAGVDVVVHMAGPFSATAAPMVEACLRTGTHYVDITGEIDVFEWIARRSTQIADAGIVALPGAGFDVVPSDCLAAHVAARLSDPRVLTLVIRAGGAPSRGTAKTAIEGVGAQRVRRGGRIVSLTEELVEVHDLGEGPSRCVPVSWGDVSTAFHTTGIPDVTVLFQTTPAIDRMASLAAPARQLIRSGLGRWLARRAIDRGPAGPSERQRHKTNATILAIASDPDGTAARSMLRTPNGYTLTAETALTVADRVAAGHVAPGFHTPAGAFGPDFVLDFDGCVRVDLDG